MGVYSFLAALLFTLLVGAGDFYKDKTGIDYLSYFENISWSISLIIIFPAVLGLTLYYYQKAPAVLTSLYHTLVVSTNSGAFDQLCMRIDRAVNTRLIPIAVLLAVLVVNFVYFWPYLNDPNYSGSWMMFKGQWQIFYTQLTFRNQFTFFGYIGAIIQIFLTYWVLMFVVKNLIFIRGLYEFFRCDEYKIKLNPLHPDGVNGLGKLMELATLQAVIILFVGLYASLKVIDKIFQQQAGVLDIGNVLVLLGYVIFAPLLFFLILGAAHQKMRDSKEDFLGVLSSRISVLIDKTSQTTSATNEQFKENAEQLKFLQDQYAMYSQRISVWPFNWRSLQGFFGAVVTPIIPPISAAISYALNFIK